MSSAKHGKKPFFPFHIAMQQKQNRLNKGKGWNFASDEDVYVCCA